MANKFNNMMNLLEDNRINEIVKICNQLSHDDFRDIIKLFLSVMQTTDNINLRNTLAIVFMDLKWNGAVPVIIKLINQPENAKCTGTLIYALQELDCTNEMKNIIHTFFDGSYEAQYNMLELFKIKSRNMTCQDKQYCIDTMRSKMALPEYQTDFYIDLLDEMETLLF